MKYGWKSTKRCAWLFAAALLVGAGCQAVHEDVLEYDRPEVDLDETEQVRRLLDSANSYLKSEIYPEAEKNYRKVLRIDPANRTANINLSYALRKQQRADEAFDLDYKFTQRFPDDAEGHARLAAAYAGDRDDIASAAKSMERAIAIDGKEVSYYTDLGYYYAELEQYDEAIGAYEKAAELDPENETTQKALVQLYEKSGDVEALIRSKEKQLADDPENARLLNDLAKLKRDQEDYTAAAEYYERLSKVDEGNAAVLRNLAVCYLQVPDSTAALETYKRVVEADPNDTESYVRLAELEGSPTFQRYSDAIKTVRIALDRDEGNARGWCVWGKALENLKQYDQAKTKFNKAVELNDPVWSAYASQELVRQDQLIERAKKLADKAKYEATEYGD